MPRWAWRSTRSTSTSPCSTGRTSARARSWAPCPSATEERSAAMEILTPDTLDEALEMKAAHPDARPIAGGTDLMVELNFDRARPAAIMDLGRVAELREHGRSNGTLRVGAGVSYTRLIR